MRMDEYLDTTGCQFSLYPLGQGDIDTPIQEAIEAVAGTGLPVRVGQLSTLIHGGEEEVFLALRLAFQVARKHGPVVLAATISSGLPSEQLVLRIQQERVAPAAVRPDDADTPRGA
jgi:uncharacterized protein YqgV (UPF0045/DUF77 family)